MNNPIVVCISDFEDDYYHGVMKGMVLKSCPSVQLTDLPMQHRFNILSTSWILYNSFNYYPDGTIFLIVVDPGVGTSRNPILVEFENKYIIAPDNGIISPLIKKGNAKIVKINQKSNISATFHGRDLFAPTAGNLANEVLSKGRDKIIIEEYGEKIENYNNLEIDFPAQSNSGIITYIDCFDNIITNIQVDLEEDVSYDLEINNRIHHLSFHKTFENGPVDMPFLIKGSAKTLEIVKRQGSAFESFDVEVGSPIEINISS